MPGYGEYRNPDDLIGMLAAELREIKRRLDVLERPTATQRQGTTHVVFQQGQTIMQHRAELDAANTINQRQEAALQQMSSDLGGLNWRIGQAETNINSASSAAAAAQSTANAAQSTANAAQSLANAAQATADAATTKNTDQDLIIGALQWQMGQANVGSLAYRVRQIEIQLGM